MQNKTTLSLGILILIGYCLIFILSLSVVSQTPDRHPPTITDFGKSLRKKPVDKTESAEGIRNDENVIKVETNLVRTDVLVIDRSGNAVLGLKANDFIVTENNIPQEIGTFSLGNSVEIPRSIVLIIDYSGSQIPFIKTSVEAAKVLVDKLSPKDTMAIVTDDVELLVSPTHDKALLKKKLDSLVDNVAKGNFVNGEFVGGKLGKSLQYSALLASVNELFDDEDIRPIIIFQSDGDQFFNIKSANPRPFGFNTSYEPDFTIEALFDRIEKSRVTIYSVISGFSLIGLSREARLKKTADLTENLWKANKLWKPDTVKFAQYVERLYLEQDSMNNVAQLSGGFAENLEIPEQADEIYSRIFYGITNRYLIGYYPTDQEHDTSRRNVKVEVRGHPEYIVWGRKFYFAAKP